MNYTFRAAGPDDFTQVWRLNHRAFAEELAQHTTTDDGLLIDKHEAKSRYFIALHGEEVVGMVCINTTPPFSVESRLADLAILDTLQPPLIEVRLLAIDPAHRSKLVMAGLLSRMMRDILAEPAGTLLISGVSGRVEMYQRFGFRALGPPVPSGRASFVPMALRLSDIPEFVWRGLERDQRRTS